ncbi:MAG: glycogen synthase [Fibrobacterota bacterium]
MKTLFFTNEYPPNVYGGAGIHVEYLTKELSKRCSVEVRCFGVRPPDGNEDGAIRVKAYDSDKNAFSNAPEELRSPLKSVDKAVKFNIDPVSADIVHCHTWYTHLAGVMCRLLYGTPLVVTTHSLEPLRPWKRDQLGRGYDFSSWAERYTLENADGVIAVSEGTKKDILDNFSISADKIKVIPNGIDVDEYKPEDGTKEAADLGLDPDKPFVMFVGRVTRQKGITHLINALKYMDPDIQALFCAGAPDTPAIAEEVRRAYESGAAGRKVVWIEKMLSKKSLIKLYSKAAVFCCPSIYEPFGIINLEAMACGTPVVSGDLGGMREIIIEGVTGVKVPVAQSKEPPFEPLEPDAFSHSMANAVNMLCKDEDRRKKMGKAARKRAVDGYSWKSIAENVHSYYQEIIECRKKN